MADDAHRAAGLIGFHGMQCYCLSTTLFHDDVTKGAAQFAKDNLAKILRILAIAKILKPRFIRLLPAKIGNRAEVPDSIDWLQQNAGRHTAKL